MDMGLDQNQFLYDQFMAFPPFPPVTGVLSDQSMDLPPFPPVIGSDQFMALPPLPTVSGSQFFSYPFTALPPLAPVTGSQIPSDEFMALPALLPVIGSQEYGLMSSHLTGIGDINNIGGGSAIFSQDQQPYTNNSQLQLQHVYAPNNMQAPPLGQLPASSSADLYMEFSQFSFELDRQTTEMEAYLHLQNQSLNATNLLSLIQIKENEAALAEQRRMEMEQRILRTHADVETWKKFALQKEAEVTKLSKKLKRVKERIKMLYSGALDANSTCGETSRGRDKSTMDVYGKCKVCQAQCSCVLSHM